MSGRWTRQTQQPTLDAAKMGGQRWTCQNQRPTHWQSAQSINPFKSDRNETKNIHQARVDIHKHKHAIIMKNGWINRPPHLHLPLAGIRWVLQPFEDRGAHGAQLRLIVEVREGHEEPWDARNGGWVLDQAQQPVASFGWNPSPKNGIID